MNYVLFAYLAFAASTPLISLSQPWIIGSEFSLLITLVLAMAQKGSFKTSKIASIDIFKSAFTIFMIYSLFRIFGIGGRGTPDQEALLIIILVFVPIMFFLLVWGLENSTRYRFSTCSKNPN